MKRIPLTQRKFAIVDDSDFKWLNQFKWHISSNGYVRRKIRVDGRPKHCLMHRFILNAPKGKEVDHINGIGTDNRRCNIRFATRLQNTHNLRKIRNQTKYKGVREGGGKYSARITVNKIQIYLGNFYTAPEAAKAYDLAALRYYGQFAATNKEINGGQMPMD